MSHQPDLQEWNLQTLQFMQALLGSISPNFRMVALAHEKGVWNLLFVLENEDAEDREEIDDIGVEFEALQEGSIKYEIETHVTCEDIPWPSFPTRVVYRRRERSWSEIQEED